MDITREDVIAIIVEELPRLISERPLLRYTLAGALAESLVHRAELKEILQAIQDLREDFNTRFEEHSAAIRQLSERMEEHSAAIRQLSKRMEEHSAAIRQLMERQEEFSRRLESSIGGLGARWGILSEEAFRNGVASILSDIGLRVEHFWYMDTEGVVFGRPDQVEVDVVVRDGQVILMEIKSSVGRADVYTFQRKVELYERVRETRVARRIIVSPFVEASAAERARAMGIEVYTSGYDVPTDAPR
ncbi:MAG: DUF3782 domain-containing protein [Anaerolineae bacterium]|jgi:hypothetical protein|nr:DUF3782 domain-containing protein [Anaerolineae bacterium]MDH7474193.1 DUF3782 domain-containing protein [Anaerolineae bacterium]